MAELESEALLLGHWKNVEELENSISLPELEAILKASKRREHRQNRFFAMVMKNIDIDEVEEKNDKFEEVKRRVAAKRRGETEEEFEAKELAAFGIEVATDWD